MEENLKNQQSSATVIAVKSKLRYPLRSSGAGADAKSNGKDNSTKNSPEIVNNSLLSASKRGRISNMSKSVSVLELSGKDKEKSAKPPRRLSIPTKSSATPKPRNASNNVTPISKLSSRRLANGQERCDTPLSDVSRSSIRRKFNLLSSPSYWIQQIKVSESAAKHLISLGFFKLALEANCERMKPLREELKSYVKRYNLAEFEETVKSLFESYEIPETMEQLQESVICSNVPEDVTTLSNDDVQSTSSTAATSKLKPKSVNAAKQAFSAKVSSKKDNLQKVTPASKVRASVSRDHVKPRLAPESGDSNVKKKVQKPENGVGKIKQQDGKTEVMDRPPNTEAASEGNKENMDAPLMGDVSVAEAI